MRARGGIIAIAAVAVGLYAASMDKTASMEHAAIELALDSCEAELLKQYPDTTVRLLQDIRSQNNKGLYGWPRLQAVLRLRLSYRHRRQFKLLLSTTNKCFGRNLASGSALRNHRGRGAVAKGKAAWHRKAGR